METDHDYLFKIILIGDSGVGKTSLMRRYTDNTYVQGGLSTIGVDFKIKTITVNNKKVKLQMWDTAGQERFRAIVSSYYRGVHGILLVFDMLNRDTFERLPDWIDELKRKDVPKNTAIVVLGNKVDEKNSLRVSREEINKLLTDLKIPLSNFFEVSAKDGQHVEECFNSLTTQLIQEFGQSGIKTTSKIPFKVKEEKKKGCC